MSRPLIVDPNAIEMQIVFNKKTQQAVIGAPGLTPLQVIVILMSCAQSMLALAMTQGGEAHGNATKIVTD